MVKKTVEKKAETSTMAAAQTAVTKVAKAAAKAVVHAAEVVQEKVVAPAAAAVGIGTSAQPVEPPTTVPSKRSTTSGGKLMSKNLATAPKAKKATAPKGKPPAGPKAGNPKKPGK